MTIKNECELEYVACGCNRTTQALSWGGNGLIAYGGCNSVFIYQPKKYTTHGEITSVLNGHKARVNCIKWMEQLAGKGLEVISGSSDKSVILWQKTDQDLTWKVKQQLVGHLNAVCSLASVTFAENGQSVSFIASAGSDSTVRIWRRDACSDFVCCQTLTFGNGFAHALDISILPNSKGVLLACGCDDTLIRLYVLKEKLFHHVLSLHGHEDWVRTLTFTKTSKETDLLLASGSQDTYIRLWRVCSSRQLKTSGNDLALKEEAFVSGGEKFHVVLESVLIGHEGWVQGVSWSPFRSKTPTLLSASMDKTMIIWEYDDENQVWLDQARMGDVGGNTLGYYGCAFGADGQSVVGHDYQGALRMWSREEDGAGNQWKSIISVSGHFGEVEDLEWDPAGEFAITVSTDQTTRLFAPWKKDQNQVVSWHEIARPQIHGYDMKCLSMLSRYKYAAGAQEKVVRVFSAPKAFHDSFASICKVQEDGQLGQTLPLGATIAVLGLSNKAVYEGDIRSWEKDKEQRTQPMKASAFANEDPAPFNPTLISEPPVEDVLLQNTLWPETQKLYGHGFELFAIASSQVGDVLASSCKASKQEYANILIWDTTTWSQKDSLIAHSLTVTQICFSPCDKYLLSVSRDRTWALHKRSEDDNYKFTLVQKTDKKTSIHSRIIWACDWTTDSKYFATVSRDKRALMWGSDSTNQRWSVQGEPLDLEDSVTAVSISKRKTMSERYIVALGLESGGVHVFAYNEKSERSWGLVHTVSKLLCPVLTVKRLRWRPLKEREIEEIQLGVCSSDHSFRILNFSWLMFS